jgi:hypothetical protein
MDKIKAACIGIIAADAVINVIACIQGRREARADAELKEALLANRDAALKRNEILEKETECLKSIIEAVTRKEAEHERERQGAAADGAGAS